MSNGRQRKSLLKKKQIIYKYIIIHIIILYTNFNNEKRKIESTTYIFLPF